MPKFYHLDRDNSLVDGQILELRKINDIICNDEHTSELLQRHFNYLYPKGVCSHGDNYFAKSRYIPYLAPFVELLFENSRRIYDNTKPSRAEVVFGLDNIDDFRKLTSMMNININKCSIWEVECEKFFKADMFILDTVQNLIFTNQSILASSKLMELYWQGKGLNEFIETEASFWEYLLVPPVKVVKRVL